MRRKAWLWRIVQLWRRVIVQQRNKVDGGGEKRPTENNVIIKIVPSKVTFLNSLEELLARFTVVTIQQVGVEIDDFLFTK